MRVYSEGSEPLTGGSYKLLYAGPSSPRTRLVVNPGTSRAEFVNVSDLGDNYAYGGDVLTKGSFVRIGGVDGTLAKPAPRSLIVLNSGFESHSTRYFSTLWPPDSTGGAQATPRFVRDTENSLTRVGAEGSRYAGLMA